MDFHLDQPLNSELFNTTLTFLYLPLTTVPSALKSVQDFHPSALTRLSSLLIYIIFNFILPGFSWKARVLYVCGS